ASVRNQRHKILEQQNEIARLDMEILVRQQRRADLPDVPAPPPARVTGETGDWPATVMGLETLGATNTAAPMPALPSPVLSPEFLTLKVRREMSGGPQGKNLLLPLAAHQIIAPDMVLEPMSAQ